MKMFKYLPVLLLTLSTACAGESAVAPNPSRGTSQSNTAAPSGPTSTAPAAQDPRTLSKPGSSGTKQANPAQSDVSLAKTESSQVDTTPTDRKIIRNADLSLEADSPEELQRKITAIAESKGGFVVESQQSSSDIKVTIRDIVTMSIRVPAQKFGETLDEVRKSGGRVIVESVKGEDVTEEFIDIEARLKAKRALESQFMEIMKRASSVEDALHVQTELSNVRSEIERIEGRKHFLENQASLSTVKVRIQTPAAFSANSTGFFYRLGQSFGTGIDFALSFILGLVTFVIAILPFLLFIALPLYLLLRYLIRKLLKRKAVNERTVSEIAEDEIGNP